MPDTPPGSAAGCTDEHARFCSTCTTARLYNSIHCQDCPEGRPSAATPPASAACPYCGLTDHTGREHLQFVVSLSDPPGDPEEGDRVMAELKGSAARLTKPSKAHNALFAPATCLCVECSRKVLALRCPVVTINPHMRGGNLQCGNFKGHRGDHTMLVATTFVIAEERVRLDG